MYAGQFNNGRRTIPSFCPFCLYNENLSFTERISATMSQVTRSNNSNHIAVHIDVPDFPSTCMCPCFSITCTYQQETIPQELANHLTNVHGIVVPKTTRKEQREAQKKARALGEIYHQPRHRNGCTEPNTADSPVPSSDSKSLQHRLWLFSLVVNYLPHCPPSCASCQ